MISFVKKHYPILLLVIFPLVFYYPVFLGYSLFPAEAVLKNHSPWKELPINENNLPWTLHRFQGGDPVFAHYPWKLLGVEMMKRGEWPLWNSHSLAGEPLLANSQSALFYPVNILYWILDFPAAWSASNILQVILGGLFCYLFLRSYKLSKFSSLWGSFIFAWNGFSAYFFHIQVVGQVLIWLPLALLALKEISKKWKVGWYLILIFSLANMFLGGFLQFAFYNILVMMLFILFNCRKTFLHFLTALFASLSVASIQLLPVLEYLTKSFRNAREFYDNDFLLSGWEIIKFLTPRFFGYPIFNNWWGDRLGFDRAESSYIGILGVTFAIIGTWYVFRSKINRFWAYITVLFIFISFKSPFTDFLYSLPIPFLNSVAPARGLGILALPLAFLSATGIEIALVKSKKLVISNVLLVLTIFITIVLFALLVIQSRFLIDEIAADTMRKSLFFLMAFSAISMVVFICVRRKFLPLVWGLAIIFSLQTLDLVRENKVFTRVFSESSALYPATPLTDYLNNSNLNGSRFLSFDLFTLTANTFIPYNLSTYSSYDAIHLKSAENFAKLLFLQFPQIYTYDPRAIRYSFLDKNVVNLLNIKYLLSPEILKNQDYILLDKIGNTYVYENKDAYPRSFLVSDYKVKQESDKDWITNLISTDLQSKVYLHEKLDVKLGGFGGEVNLLKKGEGYYRWDVITNEAQLLFVSEGFDDGWMGFVDGSRTKIHKANLGFMGMVVPGGKHLVELRYIPASFEWGKVISFGTVFLGGTALFFYGFKILRERKLPLSRNEKRFFL